MSNSNNYFLFSGKNYLKKSKEFLNKHFLLLFFKIWIHLCLHLLHARMLVLYCRLSLKNDRCQNSVPLIVNGEDWPFWHKLIEPRLIKWPPVSLLWHPAFQIANISPRNQVTFLQKFKMSKSCLSQRIYRNSFTFICSYVLHLRS